MVAKQKTAKPETQAAVKTKTARKKAVTVSVVPAKKPVVPTQSKTTKKKTETKKTATRVRRKQWTYSWDVVSAQKQYVLNHRETYATIATQYGVSESMVAKFASENQWSKLREELIESGHAQFEEKHRQIIAETNDRHLKLYKNMIAAGNNAMARIVAIAGKNVPDVKELRLAAMTLKDGIEGERTVLGLPTMIMKSDKPQAGDNGVLTLTDFIEQAEQLEERTYDTDA